MTLDTCPICGKQIHLTNSYQWMTECSCNANIPVAQFQQKLDFSDLLKPTGICGIFSAEALNRKEFK